MCIFEGALQVGYEVVCDQDVVSVSLCSVLCGSVWVSVGLCGSVWVCVVFCVGLGGVCVGLCESL